MLAGPGGREALLVAQPGDGPVFRGSKAYGDQQISRAKDLRGSGDPHALTCPLHMLWPVTCPLIKRSASSFGSEDGADPDSEAVVNGIFLVVPDFPKDRLRQFRSGIENSAVDNSPRQELDEVGNLRLLRRREVADSVEQRRERIVRPELHRGFTWDTRRD